MKQVDLESIQKAVREILVAVGEDPQREGLQDTPRRVAKMYAEVFSGIHKDPKEEIKTVFSEKCEELVLVRDIPFDSMCEHHLLPFTGKAHVAYIPKNKILGLSKFARLVETLARRPQVQERLTNEIAETLMQCLNPQGVAVILTAQHTCMTIRGVRKPGSSMTTSCMLGRFRQDSKSRNEVLTLLK